MHDTALIAGKLFSETYGKNGYTVLDIGGLNINGSLRNFFVEGGMNYICVDIESHPSVDIVVEPGNKLPFETGTVDLIVSTSCFEHDPCFWLTFKEMSRILKIGGHIYVNAPSNGIYHEHPGDNWRFYSDAGQALSYWSNRRVSNEEVYPVKVVETFNILGDNWNDFVCIFKRCESNDSELNYITVQTGVLNNIGKLESTINSYGLQTRHRC